MISRVASASTSDSLRRDSERLDVAGAVEELVLQREVAEQRLVERLSLLGQGLDGGRGAAEERADHVGMAAEVADRRLDRLGAGTPVGGVLREFALDGLGAGLVTRVSATWISVLVRSSTARSCAIKVVVVVDVIFGFAPSALMVFVGAGCTCTSCVPVRPSGNRPPPAMWDRSQRAVCGQQERRG